MVGLLAISLGLVELEMTKVSIDIETFSEADLKTVGVHSYAEHPSTEVLCICYAFDDEPVELYVPMRDLFIPDRLRQHIESGGILSAFNAEFERTVLNGVAGSKIAFPKISIQQMRCSMVKARAHGLPGGLGDVAKALGTHAKSDTGRVIMLQLARPRTGKESRYTIENSPDKFEQLYEYCRDDVEAERAIDQVVPDLSASELALYHLDQTINLRGVAVDMDSVGNAQYLIDEYKKQLREKCIEITGITPSQTGKLAEWIRDKGYPQLQNLQAETVKNAVEDPACPERIRTVLRIYSTHGAKAVSKFTTLKEMACKDGRLRGLFRFYGAATGRWCLTGDHEVLTPSGWCRLSDWQGGRLMCWSPDSKMGFEDASANEFSYKGELVNWESERFSQSATPEHRMPVVGIPSGLTVEQVHTKMKIPRTGKASCSSRYSEAQLRFFIMAQADGHFKDRVWKFSFTKSRKEKRCRAILKWLGLEFNYNVYERDTDKPRHVFTIHLSLNPRASWLADLGPQKEFPWELLFSDHDIFFEELELWDGYRCGPQSIQYSSVNAHNANFVQAKAHIGGRQCNLLTKLRNGEGEESWNTAYICNIWLSDAPTSTRSVKKTEQRAAFDGTVYCPKTPTGFFLVRRNGRCWITGNSSTGVQLQNLARGHIEDPDNAITAFGARDLDWVRTIYPSIDPMKVLASTVRGMLVAPQGKTLQSLDFSAIEARVCAWLLGEEWKLDAFRAYDAGTGPDLYKVAYARSFGIDAEDVTKQQRQIGKVQELALSYEGGVGAFVTMVGTYGIKLDELAESAYDILPAEAIDSAEWMWGKFGIKSGLPKKQYIVCDALKYLWRQAHPNIRQGWKDLKSAAEQAVHFPGKAFEISTKRAAFKVVDRWLYMRLPSGRKLAYYNPRWIPEKIVPKKDRFGQTFEEVIPGELRYWGVDTYTRQWMEVSTYGGKICENLTQAASRDLLANGMLNLEQAGYPTVMTVHDEVVSEIADDFDSFEHAGELMCKLPAWAKDLPVAVDGHRARRYRK